MRSQILLWSSILVALSGCGGKDNHPPVATAQSQTSAEDTLLTGTLQGTDPDNDPLTYSTATSPSHGAVTVQPDGAFQYQPAANFNGNDSFQFQVADPSGAVSRATVSITVTPVNDPPTTTATTFNGVQDGGITGKIPGADVDGDPLVFAVVAQPAHGTLVSFDAQGNFTYQPNPGYYGSDTFSASITDPLGATTTGVFTLRVDGPPQANNDIVSVTAANSVVVDVLANDTDPENDLLTVQIGTPPTIGTATVTPDNKIALTLPSGFRGFTRFTYQATDPSGLSSAATAVVFVGTPVARLSWIGDEFNPGTDDIVVSDFIKPWAADAPLPAGDTIDPFTVLYRNQSDQPAVGFRTLAGDAYWANLDKPGSAQFIANSAYITDIDSHTRLALYTNGYALSLVALDGSATGTVLNPPNYCGGSFGPAGTTVFLGCTGPANNFPSPTNYWLQVSAPGAITQLAPPIDATGGPNPPFVTPDGTAVIYDATRTDSSGTFHALFRVNVSAPGQEIQISPRFTTLNEGAGGSMRVTPDGTKLLYSGFSTSNAGYCDLYVYDMINGGPPALINGPHASASCPIEYDISPDSSRVVYTLPPVGAPRDAALYETALGTPGVVNTIFAGGVGYYTDFRYDETGTDIIYIGTAVTTGASPTLDEWHRADGSIVQLSPTGDVVASYGHNDDWSIIAYAAQRNGSYVYDQRVLNRAVPGQALQLSNAAAIKGVLLNDFPGAYFITK